ncbi:MAG: bifunctional 3'-5' exonuclease/DNA polymerase, partial [Gemmataceae bacterium]|nr:bifunctional 3'-5' exonuclease/DNA polymerase [Gemmataceae bacterium]
QLVKMYGGNWLAGAMIRDGRVYPGWRQIGAATGRSACAHPNMMQVPREKAYRNCVRAEPGRTLVKCDYATLQMRIACDIARDVAMFQAFHAEAQGGPDIHTATARMLLGKQDVTKADRQIAKSAGFGLLFGMSAKGLRIYSKTTFGVDFTEDEATRHRETWLAGYPGIARWHKGAYQGKATQTRTRVGRRRILPASVSPTWVLNSPVQGTEADGAKLALALLWERRVECPGAVPVIFNHDEIVLDVPIEQAEQARLWLEEAMSDGMEPQIHPVPTKVEGKITPNWGG